MYEHKLRAFVEKKKIEKAVFVSLKNSYIFFIKYSDKTQCEPVTHHDFNYNSTCIYSTRHSTNAYGGLVGLH